MKSLMLAAALAAAVPAKAAEAPYTVECTENGSNIVFASFGPKGPKFRSRTDTQRYTVDPARKTVTLAFSYENDQRLSKPTTLSNAIITPGGRVVFCGRTDGKCEVDNKVTQTSRTIGFKHGMTILNVAKGDIKYSSTFNVTGNDGSWYTDNGWTTGTCKKV